MENASFDNAVVCADLSRGEVARFRFAEPVHLHVTAGVVWLTRAGSAEDHICANGEMLELAPGETAVVSGLSTARIRVVAVAPAAGRSRWPQWWLNMLGRSGAMAGA